jgi:LysR family transcriptional activator of mexEF-oprN operon
VVVSHNGDLRGLVEDSLGIERRVACSVDGFSELGAIVSGTSLVATVPDTLARRMKELYPRLRTAALPFRLPSSPAELLWRTSEENDPGQSWLREQIRQLARGLRA